MKTTVHPIPPPEPEKKVPPLTGQQCQKCEATFRWERSESDRPGAPLVLRLLKASDKCDCGYGRVRRQKQD